jgi:hypothetical protein
MCCLQNECIDRLEFKTGGFFVKVRFEDSDEKGDVEEVRRWQQPRIRCTYKDAKIPLFCRLGWFRDALLRIIVS